MLLREIPKWELPREKGIMNGIASLSTVELIAIIIRTGTKGKSVLQLAQEILYQLPNLQALPEQTINEITAIKGVGKAKAITLLASIELAKRIISDNQSELSFTNPEVIFNHFKSKFVGLTQEQLMILYLNTKGRLISAKIMSIGSINMTIINPKDLLKWALKLSAAAIILIHNHPSGDPTPSANDVKATVQIIKAAKQLDILVLDHLIFGNTFYSMQRQTNIFEKPSGEY